MYLYTKYIYVAFQWIISGNFMTNWPVRDLNWGEETDFGRPAGHLTPSPELFKVICTSFLEKLCCAVLSCFSCVRLCAALWVVACQAPLSMGFSFQEQWSGLPFASPGIFQTADPGIKPMYLMSPALVVGGGGWFFTTSAPWAAQRASVCVC